jgi:hypothetical protein
MSCKMSSCSFDVCIPCSIKTSKMGVMDGFGIWNWADGRCFEGVFAADFPQSGRLVEVTGEVYTVRYAGDKKLHEGAKPISRRLISFYEPLSLDLDKVVCVPRLIEVVPVEAYTGLHPGLLQNESKISNLVCTFRTVAAAIPNVVRQCLSRSQMYAFFLSMEGISNREIHFLKKKWMDSSSMTAKENVVTATIVTASDSLSQIRLDHVPTHMDLLLELLCSLLVTDPNGVAAQTTLGVLHRFLSPLQHGEFSTTPTNTRDTAGSNSPFTDRQLDRYTEMLEELLVRGSATTRLTATECLLRIAAVRGGLRHVSRAAIFLEKLGLSLPLTAVSNINRLVDSVESTLETDLKRAVLKDGLFTSLAAAWSKYAPHGQMSTLPRTSIRALKILVYGLIRLLVHR